MYRTLMQFKALNVDDHQTISPYFDNQWYELCAYTPLSLTAWQSNDFITHWTRVDDALLISSIFPNDPSKNHLILPVAGDKLYPPETLAAWARDGGYTTYWFVPRSYLERVGMDAVSAYFHVEEDKEYTDYVYLTSDLAELKGKKYAKKRNLIHQFEREYDVAVDVAMERITPENADECLAFLDEWCIRRACENGSYSLACEREAVIRTLTNTGPLKVNGMMMRLKGTVSAFAISEALTSNMGVLHFEKAFAEITGLYQYFDRQVARDLLAGYLYINKESDMGEPGLAKAKKSYYPVKMATCFQLKLKD